MAGMSQMPLILVFYSRLSYFLRVKSGYNPRKYKSTSKQSESSLVLEINLNKKLVQKFRHTTKNPKIYQPKRQIYCYVFLLLQSLSRITLRENPTIKRIWDLQD